MAGASSAFRMGDGVMDKWKVFRRKSCDFAALVLKIDSEGHERAVLQQATALCREGQLSVDILSVELHP